jgi:enoyl-CoA hydratase/carnithine racemase
MRQEGEFVNLIEYKRKGLVTHLVLNRPSVLNAVSDDLIRELKAALFEFDADEEAFIAILSGNGRAFCSGGDVRQRQLRPIEEIRRLGSAQGRDAKLEDLMYGSTNWKPIIAAVHGYVCGAGLYMALTADMIVAAEGTQFQVTEMSRGVDSTKFWHLLKERASAGFATDVCLTGRFWSAEEGLAKGAADRVVPAGQQVSAAEELAAAILQNPPLAVRALTEARRGRNAEIEMRAWIARPRGLHLTEDFRESALAFVEKRKPVFRGR